MNLAAIVILWYGQGRPVEGQRLNQEDVEKMPDGGYKIKALRRKRGVTLNHFFIPAGPAAAVCKRWFDQLPPATPASANNALFFACKSSGQIDFTRRAPVGFVNKGNTLIWLLANLSQLSNFSSKASGRRMLLVTPATPSAGARSRTWLIPRLCSRTRSRLQLAGAGALANFSSTSKSASRS
jgi:hypothetical protein